MSKSHKLRHIRDLLRARRSRLGRAVPELAFVVSAALASR
jgi:hypothetical protein